MVCLHRTLPPEEAKMLHTSAKPISGPLGLPASTSNCQSSDPNSHLDETSAVTGATGAVRVDFLNPRAYDSLFGGSVFRLAANWRNNTRRWAQEAAAPMCNRHFIAR
jgi:hypothetical protein